VKLLEPSRYAVGVIAAVALLAGCAGAQPPIGVPGAPQQASALAARPDSANYKVLYSFAGSPDGSSPVGSMIDVGGKLYGTTESGGAYDTCGSTESSSCGTVFRITTDGKEKVLYSFHALPDGDVPLASLLDVGGTLYGTTEDGGAYGGGTVFSITPAGTENVLHGFGNGTDGVDPTAGLIDVGGTLYSTTAEGGHSSRLGGTVFSITTSGTEKVLRSFNGRRGSRPLAGLIDVGGTLYGTTYQGGAHNSGVVFSITPSGKERVVHSFGNGTDGVFPMASLIKVKGTLYGTTDHGGAYCSSSGGCGTIFSITPDGTEKVLHSFGAALDGCCSQAGLTDVHGTLYGTTSAGGADGFGTVFALTP
jgi:uncharacterized repeat protein (TIGR03803 family)